MHPDAGLLLVARVLRNFSYGYLVVVVGIYLDQLGLTPIEVGAVLTASAAGSAALTIGWSLLADRIGRQGPDAYRPLFVLFAIVGLASFSLFLRLSPAVELVPTTVRPSGSRLGLGGSSGLIGLLVALNVIDSLAGGLMVQSIVAYW